METSVERRQVTGRQDVDHDYVCIVMSSGVDKNFEWEDEMLKASRGVQFCEGVCVVVVNARPRRP